MMHHRLLPLAGCLLLAVVGCKKENTGDGLQGEIAIDGSSTVAPVSTVAAEFFTEEHPDVRITVGISGTGGGFKRFLSDQADLRTDINDASRPIKESEVERARELGIEFIEMPIGIDGIAVVANPANDWCDHLTVEELKLMWEPESKVQSWKDVRDGFPDVPLKLYGPGTDSGTFEYFTEAIVGKPRASRSDYTMSEDDNVLVQGVRGTKGSLGYFGFSYYEANKDKLKLLGIDNGTGNPVTPSLDVIRQGHYEPLSRPLFLYINAKAADRPVVQSFVQFYLNNAPRIVEHPTVNYVALSEELYAAILKRFESRKTGSMIAASGGEGPVNLNELYVGN